MKREIQPEELEFVFDLAMRYSDLRSVGRDLEELDDLRERVKELVVQLDGGRNLSIGDLVKLQAAGIVSKPEVRRLIGLSEESARPEVAPEVTSATVLAEEREPTYRVTDRRVHID